MIILYLLVIGAVAGTLDVLPMIKMKLDKYSIVSAFVFHFTAPTILYLIKTGIVFWLKGGITYLILALPMVILVARDDKKSVPVMCISSLVFGTVIGLIQHFLF